MSQRITIRSPNGEFDAHVARPTSPDAPAIVVIQEIFGINADMRATCDEFARHGYVAVCPDLFWRIKPGVELTDATSAEMTKALANYAAFDVDQGAVDIDTTISAVRRLDGVDGKVGVVGFCLGGLMAFLAAARSRPDVAVAYYGGGIENHLAEAAHMTTPLMIHLAGDDEFISPVAQDQIRAALDPLAQVEIETYPGCRHAFARRGGAHFDADAAAAANRCTCEFLRAHLFGESSD